MKEKYRKKKHSDSPYNSCEDLHTHSSTTANTYMETSIVVNSESEEETDTKSKQQQQRVFQRRVISAESIETGIRKNREKEEQGLELTGAGGSRQYGSTLSTKDTTTTTTATGSSTSTNKPTKSVQFQLIPEPIPPLLPSTAAAAVSNNTIMYDNEKSPLLHKYDNQEAEEAMVVVSGDNLIPSSPSFQGFSLRSNPTEIEVVNEWNDPINQQIKEIWDTVQLVAVWKPMVRKNIYMCVLIYKCVCMCGL